MHAGVTRWSTWVHRREAQLGTHWLFEASVAGRLHMIAVQLSNNTGADQAGLLAEWLQARVWVRGRAQGRGGKVRDA